MDQHPAEPFLRSLRAEEELLTAALGCANEVAAALRRADLPSALTTAAHQQSFAAQLADASALRTASAGVLAQSLGLRDGLTLSLLAPHLPEPFAAEALAVRDRLRALTGELAAVQTRNANLLGHLRSFFRGVLADLAADTAPARYGPSGALL